MVNLKNSMLVADSQLLNTFIKVEGIKEDKKIVSVRWENKARPNGSNNIFTVVKVDDENIGVDGWVYQYQNKGDFKSADDNGVVKHEALCLKDDVKHRDGSKASAVVKTFTDLESLEKAIQACKDSVKTYQEKIAIYESKIEKLTEQRNALKFGETTKKIAEIDAEIMAIEATIARVTDEKKRATIAKILKSDIDDLNAKKQALLDSMKEEEEESTESAETAETAENESEVVTE